MLGAWRHPEGLAFVFLVGNSGMTAPNGVAQLFLSFAGVKCELTRFLPQVKRLKRELARRRDRKEAEKQLGTRLQRAQTSRSLKRLMALMAPSTAVVNALAIYLRRLPAPSIGNQWLLGAYRIMLPLLYLAALMLLLVFTVLCIAYICKYGFLLVRRL